METSMYSSPKLVRYGNFRDLTQQQCGYGPAKTYPNWDVALGPGQSSDGCETRS